MKCQSSPWNASTVANPFQQQALVRTCDAKKKGRHTANSELAPSPAISRLVINMPFPLENPPNIFQRQNHDPPMTQIGFRPHTSLHGASTCIAAIELAKTQAGLLPIHRDFVPGTQRTMGPNPNPSTYIDMAMLASASEMPKSSLMTPNAGASIILDMRVMSPPKLVRIAVKTLR